MLSKASSQDKQTKWRVTMRDDETAYCMLNLNLTLGLAGGGCGDTTYDPRVDPQNVIMLTVHM